MKEKYFLVVRFWVAPEAEAPMMQWLDGGHIAEVARQPGFLWGRKINLHEKDAAGWSAWAMLYGIESRAAFEAYENNSALKAKFAKERAPFESRIRVDRFSGDTV